MGEVPTRYILVGVLSPVREGIEGSKGGVGSTVNALRHAGRHGYQLHGQSHASLAEVAGGRNVQRDKRLISAWRRAHRSLALARRVAREHEPFDLCRSLRQSSPDRAASRGSRQWPTLKPVGQLSLARVSESLWTTPKPMMHEIRVRVKRGRAPRGLSRPGLSVEKLTCRVATVYIHLIPQGRNFWILGKDSTTRSGKKRETNCSSDTRRFTRRAEEQHVRGKGGRRASKRTRRAATVRTEDSKE